MCSVSGHRREGKTNGNITIGSNPAPVSGAKIKCAAETQNKKVAKRFLAPDTGPHTCQFCDKTFVE